MPHIARERLAATGILVVGLLAALAVYAPSLSSPFVGDDYLYLLASRDMPLGEFLRAAFVRGSDPGQLLLARDYWRPLSFLSFRGLYAIFGGSPLGYHLFNLAIHLAGIVIVWLLARRLTRRTIGVAVATFVFTVHPAGVESITWISAINSAALPFALAGWLAFIIAVDVETRSNRWRWHAPALFLIAVALGFRETSAVVLPALVLWYLLVPSRDRLGSWRTYLPLVPYGALSIVYLLVSTDFFTADGGRLLRLDLDADVHQTWFYVKQALLPMQPASGSAFYYPQVALGLVVLATPLLAFATRRWLLLALGLGFLLSLLPYGAFSLGFGPRYFYFPSAFLALALGEAAAELLPQLRRLLTPRPTAIAAPAGIAVVLLVLIVVANNRVSHWVNQNPDQQEAWVDELRQCYPDLPNNGILYATNVPFIMSIFDGYILEPTVAYYYPQGTHPVKMFNRIDLESVRPWVAPNDRLFVFGENGRSGIDRSSKASCARDETDRHP